MTALKFVLYRFLSVSMYLDSTKGRSPLRRVLGMSRLTLKPLEFSNSLSLPRSLPSSPMAVCRFYVLARRQYSCLYLSCTRIT